MQFFFSFVVTGKVSKQKIYFLKFNVARHSMKKWKVVVLNLRYNKCFCLVHFQSPWWSHNFCDRSVKDLLVWGTFRNFWLLASVHADRQIGHACVQMNFPNKWQHRSHPLDDLWYHHTAIASLLPQKQKKKKKNLKRRIAISKFVYKYQWMTFIITRICVSLCLYTTQINYFLLYHVLRFFFKRENW